MSRDLLYVITVAVVRFSSDNNATSCVLRFFDDVMLRFYVAKYNDEEKDICFI